jgi:hypothetical protein
VRRAGKEPVPKYNSDSDAAPGHALDTNLLSGFYSNSAYEFEFGLDPEDPESEDNTTEQPLSGPASGLVITSTPAGRLLTVKIRQPSHEFTFGVGMSFIPYPLVLTPVV